MPAEVGLGRPRKREDPFSFTRFMRDAAGLVWQGVSAEDAAGLKDQEKAERGARLAQLVSSRAPADIWIDLWDLITAEFDAALEQLMDAVDTGTPDAVLTQAATLKAYRNIVAQVDKRLVLGHGAMVRLGKRRLASGLAARDAHAAPEQKETG